MGIICGRENRELKRALYMLLKSLRSNSDETTSEVVEADIPTETKSSEFERVVEGLPLNVMLCDPKTMEITYANETSIETLKPLEAYLPISADELVGSSIDVFHKHPEHQRAILADANNLPHHAEISVGPEILDLQIDPIFDDTGAYIYAALSWSVITEKVETQKATERLTQMVDKMPVNAMMCDPETFEINYANETCIETLRSIEEHLPIKADELVGTCIDVFHKDPSHQRKILADPSNLPWNARINVGPEKLDLNVSAIVDGRGNYVGPMVTWSVITAQIAVEEMVKGATKSVHEEATKLQNSAHIMSGNAENNVRLSGAISTAAEQTSASSQTVAAATEELSASVDEIGNQMSHASKISQEAEEKTEESIKTVNGLAEASNEIGNVVNLINDIAAQTNLLALNATIEAARAGEAGKGFAVVASEVKNLAGQTATATVDIKEQVESIQQQTRSVVDAIELIQETVKQVNEISASIAGAVEEQGNATREISANVQEAAKGASEVSQSISEILASSNQNGQISSDIASASEHLVSLADSLNNEVDNMLK